MAYRYPKVEVFVDPVHNELESDDGGRDRIRRVEVDGVPWPILAVDWHGDNDRGGATISLKVRGQLRITEES